MVRIGRSILTLTSIFLLIFERLMKELILFRSISTLRRMSGTIMQEMQNFILEKHMRKDNKYQVLETKALSQISNEISEIMGTDLL